MVSKKASSLSRFLTWSSKMAGNPVTFVVALSIVILWTIIGLIVGFDSQWLLIIDTIATLNASLMVFIIQNTQNRESKALHIKIDELIRVTKEAETELIAIERMEETELEDLRKKIFQKVKDQP